MRFFPMEIGRSKKPTDPFFMEISNLWSEFEIFWAKITKNSIFCQKLGSKKWSKTLFFDHLSDMEFYFDLKVDRQDPES